MTTSQPAAPILVIIRGNSGTGRTTVAREVQRRYGRGCALLEQDHLRRIVLREHDSSKISPVAPAFIAATAANLLRLGYHVVLEGIMYRDRYSEALAQLIDTHSGTSSVFYLHAPFDETARRHQNRADTVTFTAQQMREWYVQRDVLGVGGERIIDETSSLEQTITTILHTSGLAAAPPATPCPTYCPRCAAPSGGTG
ncbi:putative kinase [Krasilnikovia cinnamomea]|uniref:Putative kinase n=1 Tax=Krasilnikovia cinnamomea TaxID=349313 RepID=A0A4Q7Z810_9ACTN|nr:AAA family ATPase [Krasilnikovia cinnamomea]RZU46578.1 putative kinase [Krasilnikovia cinnamomea]